MPNWNLKEAQDHFSELVHFSQKEPQMIHDQGHLISVVLDYNAYQQLINKQISESRPTMKELLSEIQAISEEVGDLDILPRQDRAGSMIEI